MPAIWFSEDPRDELDACLNVYLKEEIREEGVVRNLPAFSRFLKVAALSSGELVNYASVASDAAVGEGTVRSHFQILQDTLIGNSLEPFIGSKKRKAIATHKFYFFDNGVRNFILGIDNLDRHSNQYGTCFETAGRHFSVQSSSSRTKPVFVQGESCVNAGKLHSVLPRKILLRIRVITAAGGVKVFDNLNTFISWFDNEAGR